MIIKCGPLVLTMQYKELLQDGCKKLNQRSVGCSLVILRICILCIIISCHNLLHAPSIHINKKSYFFFSLCNDKFNFGHSKPIIIIHTVSSILLGLIIKFQSLQNNKSRGQNFIVAYSTVVTTIIDNSMSLLFSTLSGII